MTRVHVLVVDDDPGVRRLLRIQLNYIDCTVESADDGDEAIQKVQEHCPDVVLLDLAMPGMDGFEVCRKLRQLPGNSGSIWIIVVSAYSTDDNIVRALDAGADAYIVKPFNMEVITAYIRVGLRRMVRYQGTPVNELRFDNLWIDITRRQVYLDGQDVRLTPTQYSLLEYMALNADRPLTSEMLITKLWGTEVNQMPENTDRLRRFITEIRRALKDDARNPRFIFTEVGVGYRFRKPD